MCKREPT